MPRHRTRVKECAGFGRRIFQSAPGDRAMTIESIRQGLVSKQFTARELAEKAIAHGESQNVSTNAFLTFSRDRAMAAAGAVDKKIAAGDDPGCLAGVPIAIKDVIVT